MGVWDKERCGISGPLSESHYPTYIYGDDVMISNQAVCALMPEVLLPLCGCRLPSDSFPFPRHDRQRHLYAPELPRSLQAPL